MAVLHVSPGCAGVRVDDDWVGLATEFIGELRRLVFTPKSATRQVRLFADLGRWLDRRRTPLSELDAVSVDEFVAFRRASARELYSRRALRHLLGWLSATGRIAPEAARPAPVASLEAVALFEAYLRDERRLAPATVENLVPRVRRFAREWVPSAGLSALTPGMVSQAALAEGEGRKPSSVKKFCYTVRVFLRFCWVAGLVERDLSGALAVARSRQPSRLPVGVSAGDVERLLAGCDTATAVGLRDAAILGALARLGLRAGEAAGLTLDDIDWRGGEVVVAGKGGKVESLPLPQDVGEAIAAYLVGGRPSAECRAVFLCHRAPFTPLNRSSVGSIVTRACERVGLPRFGPHRLRHTLAEAMVAAGVPFPAIGQVLRHDSPLTTANYARVDVGRLRTLAQPWPVEGRQP
jgi:site-specific recombinase XerD